MDLFHRYGGVMIDFLIKWRISPMAPQSAARVTRILNGP
jgi:hypothetical protein